MTEKFLTEDTIKLTNITEDNKTLIFEPELGIKYIVYAKESPKEYNQIGFHTSVETDIIAYIEYDFGMTDFFYLNPNKNFLIKLKPDEITKDSTFREIIKMTIKFDLFHAFCHCKDDPNYSFKHWALYGNLRGIVTLIEKE